MLKFISQFKDLTIKNVSIAGGKGASLGEMLNNDIPVPDGFVVLASTFDQFIKETDINVEIDSELSKVKKDEVNSVDND
jgi:pyruvate,water dikinase